MTLAPIWGAALLSAASGMLPRPNQSISSSGLRAGWFIAPIFMTSLSVRQSRHRHASDIVPLLLHPPNDQF